MRRMLLGACSLLGLVIAVAGLLPGGRQGHKNFTRELEGVSWKRMIDLGDRQQQMIYSFSTTKMGRDLAVNAPPYDDDILQILDGKRMFIISQGARGFVPVWWLPPDGDTLKLSDHIHTPPAHSGEAARERAMPDPSTFVVLTKMPGVPPRNHTVEQ